jgi:hypothetical protein
VSPFFSFGYAVWRWIDQHVFYTEKYVIEDLNHEFGVWGIAIRRLAGSLKLNFIRKLNEFSSAITQQSITTY